MATEYQYRMELAWSPADDAWVVLVPDLPGCFADGPTAVEAVQAAQGVIRLWIETAQEDGERVPTPAYHQPVPGTEAPSRMKKSAGMAGD